MTRTPQQRSLHARKAAHALHASRDSREVTKNARAAFLDRFTKQVIAEADARGETLTDQEVARRAEHAKRSYMAGLAMKRHGKVAQRRKARK